MCGFAGVIKRNVVEDKDVKDVMRMNEMIRYRGPDSEGYYNSDWFTCANSRLAIIDLNERANLPMFDDEKRYILFFNGEVYNFEDLRGELKSKGHIFKTTSDTEVVLRSFIQWKADCVSRFIGMFAFVIFDLKQKEAYLFRDQIGIKPLYFYLNKDSFYFASEIKVFSLVSELKPNHEKLVEYSVFGDITGRKTLFKDVSQLLPGECMKIDKDLNFEIHQYFDIKETFLSKKKKDCSMEELEDLLNRSVFKHTKSDVGYGVQLSGGLDSSYILSSLFSHKEGKPLETFSIGLNGYDRLDESKQQKFCADKYKTKHHSYVFQNRDFEEYLAKCIWFFDYPLPHPNVVPTHIVCMNARERGMKVLLSGEGGDEIFCGYRWYFESMGSRYMQGRNEELVLRSSYNIPNQIKRVFKSSLELNLGARKEHIKGMEDEFSSLLLLDQTLHLQKWLQKQDRMGMACSIEMRVPYCNIEILKYLNSMSFDCKTNSFKDPKYLLKKIAEKYLPDDIVWRKKIGFTLPLEDWFREQQGLHSFLGYIQDETFRDRGIYDRPFVDKLISDHINERCHNGRMLWTLVNIELWHRIFIDRSINLSKEKIMAKGCRI